MNLDVSSVKHNIPVLFIYNGRVPDGYVLQSDERVFPYENHAPAMFIKLKMAIQEIYDIPQADPDYIIRTNTRTYVNMENLKFFLSHVGKDKVAAGPFCMNSNKLYLQGTCMIFSKDVAKRFAEEDNVNGPVLWHSDDCTISWAMKEYTNYYDLFTFHENNVMCAQKEFPNKLPTFRERCVSFRIKSGDDIASPYGSILTPEEEIDVQYWRLLLKEFDGLDIE